MDIGRLSSKVTLQSPPSGVDALGQPSGDWTDAATVWADIRHLSGLEAIKAGAEASLVKASIRIRYRDGVSAAQRIVWGSTTYEIKAVLPDARRRWMDLSCEVAR